MNTASTVSATIQSGTYYISFMDQLRILAGELDWNQDEIIGQVDTTGAGHYALDTIDDPATIEAIAIAVRSGDRTRRSDAVRYSSAARFATRYNAPIIL